MEFRRHFPHAFLAIACSIIVTPLPAQDSSRAASRAVGGFDSVSFETIGTLIVVQGREEYLNIDAPEDVAEKITAVIAGRTLRIGYRGIRRAKGADPIITVGMVDVRRLAASAAGGIKGRLVRAESISIAVSSSGSVSLDDCDLGAVEARLTGSGGLSLSGRARNLDLSCSSSGSFRGESLKTAEAAVRLDSSGGAIVWAVDRLDARLAGKGVLGYYGTPELSFRPSSRVENARSLGSK